MDDKRRFLIAAITVAYAIGLLAADRLWGNAPIYTLVSSGVLCVLLWLIVGRRWGAIVAILVAASVNRYTADVGGLTLKPEMVVIPIVGISLAPQLRTMLRRVDLPLGILVAWFCWSVVGGIVHAPDRVDSTRLWIMLGIAFTSAIVVGTLVRTSADLHAVMTLWLVVGVAIASFGILIHLLFQAGFDLGVQVNPVTRDPTVPGSFHESNLFGSAVMMVGLAGLALVSFGDRSRLAAAAAVSGLLAVQVSYTRTVWIACLGGVLLIVALKVFVALRTSHRSAAPLRAALRPLMVVAVGTLIGSALLWVAVDPDSGVSDLALDRNVGSDGAGEAPSPTVVATLPPLVSGTPGIGAVPTPVPSSGDVGSRIASISNRDDSSISIRIEFSKRALEDWREYPFVGSGIGSFGQRYMTTSNDRAWLSNVFVRVLHDGGIVGLGLFVSSIFVAGVRLLRLLSRPQGAVEERTLIALAVAIAAMMVAFQATEGLQLAWYWFAIGLFLAALRIAAAQQFPDEKFIPSERDTPSIAGLGVY